MSSKTLTTFATRTDRTLVFSTDQLSPIRKIDNKLATWQNGFARPDIYDVDRIVKERRLPHNAAEVVERWLSECRSNEVAVNSDDFQIKLFYESVVRDCEDQLYCYRNMRVVKTRRFERIERNLAKLAMLTAYVDQKVDEKVDEGGDSSAPTTTPETEAALPTSEPLNLELVRRHTWMSDSEDEDEQQHEPASPEDEELYDMRRRSSLATEDWARREAEREEERLQLAMRYKWPVNMRRAKTQYERAMKKQEWERDEVEPLRHSCTF
ncbi:hypothetical protein CkaCkLH20_06460 [Colletotrichum karsti]|uniref:Uncharacterized protein n=1 Tax=Colletotrichum karsti TaxID=1095194 RepID=A0A9P6LH87_9PEZI|nr:uncharacterized protein CkaCkLH20_06460 [Colletotrichum karsti]KAF9876014.1 hypothetical protein CkaCkLH20_06460 [Colletotrichum karsti]